MTEPRVSFFWATFNVLRPPRVYIDKYIFKYILLLMCIILGMYTWQLRNREVVVSQTMCVSARTYMLRLLHSRNKHDNSHYRLYKIITYDYDRIWVVCDFLEMNVYI